MKKKNILILFLILFCFSSFVACNSDKKENTDSNPIIIYDGQYSEMKIIHQMVKMLVENHTDLSVEIKDEMAPVNAWNQLIAKESDINNCYDGTLLTTYLKLDTTDIPEEMSIYDFANQTAQEKHQVELLDKIGSANTYAIGVLPETAKKYNLKTISDLAKVADKLTFGAEHDFYTEAGSMKYTPFTEFYDLHFKENKPIDISLKYSAIESGNIDVTVVYTTDGMNKKVGLVVLEDDKKFFPEYNDALLVRSDLFERYKDTAPNLKEVLNMLGGQFTNEAMTDLTYAVDVEGKSEKEVAHDFLLEKGLITE